MWCVQVQGIGFRSMIPCIFPVEGAEKSGAGFERAHCGPLLFPVSFRGQSSIRTTVLVLALRIP